MQQRQEKKENKSSLAKSGLAKMMASLDREKAGDVKNELYTDLLKAPRGERYFYWLNKTTELCREIEELEAQIEELEAEEAELFSEELAVVTPVTWLAEEKEGSADGLAEMKEKKARLKELRRQREEKVEELRTAQKEFVAQLPVPERLLGIIYPECNMSILLKYGVIACPGSTYQSTSELLSQVQPKSEKEKEQWVKGDEAFDLYFRRKGQSSEGYSYDWELLLVEIYLEKICVVYRDGRVIVV